jgi:hypothetical protein
MTNYVKTTNFLRKDSLPDASTEKIIRGSEFDTEFNNLVIAVASKANLISPILTGIPTAPTASAGSATTQLATTAFVTRVTGALGTMSSEDADAVAITGGTIEGLTSLSATDIAVSEEITSYVSSTETLKLGANWSAVQSGTDLVFLYNTTKLMKVSINGDITTAGNVTAFGAI